MTALNLGDALKAFRRDTYLHKGEPYRLVILAPTEREAKILFEETLAIMEASSLRVAMANRASMRILLVTGPEILIRYSEDSLKGIDATCVITYGAFTDAQKSTISAWNRAPLTMEVYGL